MAWEDIAERLEGMGWVGVGLGAVILVPALVPAVARGLRPAARGAIKGYLALSDRVREMFAESSEQWQDLVAEARAEHEHRTDGTEMMTMELPAEGAAEAHAAAPAEAEEPKHRARGGRKEVETQPEAG